MKQEHNKEAETVSPVVSIFPASMRYREINANYAVNLLVSLHQIPDVGSI